MWPPLENHDLCIGLLLSIFNAATSRIMKIAAVIRLLMRLLFLKAYLMRNV